MAENQWRVVVNSIADSGAGLLPVLKNVSPLSENRIASLLYQAPSELIANLPQETAVNISELLQSAGLDCQAVDETYTFTPGSGEYEVALVLDDFSQMTQILEQIVLVLGVDTATAVKIITTSPTVLIGNISENTVIALKNRFEPLGVQLDISRPAEALFDVFIGNCPPTQRQQVLRIMKEVTIEDVDDLPIDQPLLATELTQQKANQLWDRLKRSPYPVKLVNREFQRFDLRLDEAPDTPEMLQYLAQSTGMPDKIAQKIPQRTPIVLHQNIRFSDLTAHLETITNLGGKASGHLLVFQTFSLQIEQLGDKKSAIGLLKFIGDFAEPQILQALSGKVVEDKALTHPQARWLQAELKKVGTRVKLILHE